MEELIEKVEAWSKERGLNAADPRKQKLKLWEEFGELCAATVRVDRDGVIDAIGDMLVVMIIYCQQSHYPKTKELFEIDVEILEFVDSLGSAGVEILDFAAKSILDMRITIKCIRDVVTILANMTERLDTSLEECLQVAYNEIKDRRGRMVNGVFVKQEDLE